MNFIQLCELLTSEQKYKWFYLEKRYLELFDKSELSIAEVKELPDGILRIFYPVDKKKQIVKAINKALLEDNFDEVVKLKQQLKELNERTN